MSRGRHAKPKPVKSDKPALILVVLLAIAVGVAAVVLDDTTKLRWTVAGLALLVVFAFGLAQRGSRRQAVRAHDEIEQQGQEIRTLRLEISRLHEMHDGLIAEVVGLRTEVANYVAPVPAQPDPVYPSLHLPLVRAAFAEEVPAVRVMPPPPRTRGESNRVNVDADAGSDPANSRQLLDLTASEIARLRKAN